jgi:uncharacterized protein (DUF1501 family)
VLRRYFIKSSLLSVAGLAFTPAFALPAVAQTTNSGKRRKVLVLLFQRGAADGLSLVPPIAEPRYAALRPTLAIPVQGDGAALPLDGYFGLHPALGPLLPLWNGGQLAVLHAVGSPDPSRSHFDAQDYMELGTPGQKVEDGFLNRALQGQPEAQASAFRAVALQPNLPLSLSGPAPALAMASLNDFGLDMAPGGAAGGFEGMYRAAVDRTLRGVGSEAFEALHTVRAAVPAGPDALAAAGYPKSPLGRRLFEIASLIKADLGLEIAATDAGGWDTHAGQGGSRGQLANRLGDLAQALAAFSRDLGPRLDDVVLVMCTEFGRTVRQNGTQGTDHGHGSAMFVLGGRVRGRQVYARWKGLEDQNLFEGRDLPVTTDFRAPLSLILKEHLGVPDVASVFPGFKSDPRDWPRVV